jgi:deoxyribodipyrimidine photolyase
LRREDNAALYHACQQQTPVLIVYIHEEEKKDGLGKASNWSYSKENILKPLRNY